MRIDSACPVRPVETMSYFAVSCVPPAYPEITSSTPSMSWNTASVHQKQPPARTAVCLPVFGFTSTDGSGNSAAVIIAAPHSINVSSRRNIETLQWLNLYSHWYQALFQNRDHSVWSIHQRLDRSFLGNDSSAWSLGH